MCKVQKNGKPTKKYKFSSVEMITDTDSGETSASGLCGTILVLVPLAVFVILTIFYFFNTPEATNIFTLMDKLPFWAGIGAGLLGLRKFSTVIGNNRLNIGGGKDEPKRNRSGYYAASSGEEPAEDEDVEETK